MEVMSIALFSAIFIVLVQYAFAAIPCVHNDRLRDILKVNDNFQDVAVHRAAEGRRTEAEYAAENNLPLRAL